MIEIPLAITVYRTNPSGMITSTNEMTMSTVAMRFLLRRQDGGSRRSVCPVVTAITPPSVAGRNAPRSRGQ